VYKFQTSRGTDQDAEGIEGGMEWGGGVLLPSRLGGSGERRKLSQQGAPAENEFSCILELEKTHLIDKSVIFDISGRPRRPDRNAWQAGLWCAGRMLGTPALDKQYPKSDLDSSPHPLAI